MSTTGQRRPERISNAERSETTRAAVLDAVIQALIKYGYHGATSTRIAEMSGLTRGAQMHHFGTKAAMVVEALLHLHGKRLKAIREADVSDVDSLDAFIEGIWQSFDDEMWLAAAELWTAARTDEELRTALIPAERAIGHRMWESMSFTGSSEVSALGGLPPERLRALFGVITAFMRGLALYEAFDRDERRARRQRKELVALLRVAIAETATPA